MSSSCAHRDRITPYVISYTELIDLMTIAINLSDGTYAWNTGIMYHNVSVFNCGAETPSMLVRLYYALIYFNYEEKKNKSSIRKKIRIQKLHPVFDQGCGVHMNP